MKGNKYLFKFPYNIPGDFIAIHKKSSKSQNIVYMYNHVQYMIICMAESSSVATF